MSGLLYVKKRNLEFSTLERSDPSRISLTPMHAYRKPHLGRKHLDTDHMSGCNPKAQGFMAHSICNRHSTLDAKEVPLDIKQTVLLLSLADCR